MGANLSRPSVFNNSLRAQDYEVVENTQSSCYHQAVNCRILRDRLTGYEIQEYFARLNNGQEFQAYCDFYHWRLSQDHVVRTMSMTEEATKELCSTSYAVKMYTERIPIKLVEIVDIPFPDNLYVMLATLDGFNKIVNQTAPFNVHENMVCINKQGEIKVWLNDDLSKNYPVEGFNEKFRKQMARKVVDMIDQNTDRSSEPSSLRTFILNKLTTDSFEQALLLVREYSRVHKVDIPTTFESILQLVSNPNCIDELDFNILTVSKVRSTLVPIESRVNHVAMKQSTGSGFSRLEYSISVPRQSHLSSDANRRMVTQVSRKKPQLHHSVLHPSVVRTNVPVYRNTQPIPQTRPVGHYSLIEPRRQGNLQTRIPQQLNPARAKKQIQSGHYQRAIPQIVSQVGSKPAYGILKNSNPAPQTKAGNIMLAPPKNPGTSPTSQRSDMNTQTASANLSKNATQQTTHQNFIKFVDAQDSSFEDFFGDRQEFERAASKSSYFNRRPESEIRENPNIMCRDFEDQTSNQRQPNHLVSKPQINYYSPQAMHEMDPDIARDLMAMGAL